jgi:hypothetical protein
MNSNDDAIFWERLAGMPALEAEHECVLRREANCLALAMLNTERTRIKEEGRYKHQVELARIDADTRELQAQMTKLTGKLKELRKLQTRIAWRSAVQALYGEDGVAACLVWMEQQGVLPGAAC